MEFKDVLAVNEKITLIVPEGDNVGCYPSRIEDVGSDAVVVAAPTNEGSVLRVSAGDQVQVRIFQKDAMYSFYTFVQAVIWHPFPMLQLAMPDKIERHQRRSYARVDTALPARYRLIGPGRDSRLVPYKGTITNVSGGGVIIVALQSAPDIKAGSHIEVEIELPERRVRAEGVVVRTSLEERESDTWLKVAVEFQDIDERQRDMLVKYVLQRQLELRRRGLLQAMGLLELWDEYKSSGDLQAKEELVVHYLPMVPMLAGRMAMKLSTVVDYEDLVGWGVIGLMEAVEKFDPTKGIRFETYAETRIKGAMADGVREADWVPRSVRRNAKRISQAYAALETRLGRPASDEELAAELGASLEQVQKMIAEIARGALLSLDEVVQMGDDGRTVTVLDSVADPESPDPLAVCEFEDMRVRLAKAIDQLPERERLIVALHYYDELTVKEIAEILGVSEGRVSQLHARAVLRLRAKLMPGEH